MHKKHPALVGLLQALGVAIYCGLVSVSVNFGGSFFPEPPQFLGMAMVLLLLVFSAAVTGLLVFGYPVILALEKNIKRALFILGYTFLFALIIISVVLIIISLI